MQKCNLWAFIGPSSQTLFREGYGRTSMHAEKTTPTATADPSLPLFFFEFVEQNNGCA
jgi:hypothetical protein